MEQWINIILQAGNLIVLSLTLWKLIQYTSATKGILELSTKQHITNIRPYLRLQKGEPLTLVNEGKGIAVNIELKYKKGRLTKNLLSVPAMAAAPGSITTNLIPSGFEHIELNPEIEPYSIYGTYQDIEGRKYKVIFEFDYGFNDRFKIKEQIEV